MRYTVTSDGKLLSLPFTTKSNLLLCQRETSTSTAHVAKHIKIKNSVTTVSLFLQTTLIC